MLHLGAGPKTNEIKGKMTCVDFIRSWVWLLPIHTSSNIFFNIAIRFKCTIQSILSNAAYNNSKVLYPESNKNNIKLQSSKMILEPDPKLHGKTPAEFTGIWIASLKTRSGSNRRGPKTSSLPGSNTAPGQQTVSTNVLFVYLFIHHYTGPPMYLKIYVIILMIRSTTMKPWCLLTQVRFWLVIKLEVLIS